MSDDVIEAWELIESWLSLQPPTTPIVSGASNELIAGAEAELGFPLPVDLRTLWQRCAGPAGR
ncbi:hypothetical protein [Streptomyces sp. NPDC059209]|uniref:hypothetical protein n=1 Tax=Streptomyces sp. NPDC059209 TaxID=3346769 RepID=UPI0036CD997B